MRLRQEPKSGRAAGHREKCSDFPPASLFAMASLFALLLSAPCLADYKDDIGFTLLRSELGGTVPTGSGIIATQAEARASYDPLGPFMPNTSDSQFTGKSIAKRTLDSVSGYTGHATWVGQLFYGSSSSLSPGIATIDCYEANHYMQYGFLHYGYYNQPGYTFSSTDKSSPSQVANHSWVAGVTDSAVASNILSRLDFVVNTDEFIQVVAPDNGTTNKSLLISSFNAVSAGCSNGFHQRGSVAVDSTYTAGRVKPDIVVPISSTSAAAPLAASTAAVLVQTGKPQALSTDPRQKYTVNRDGVRIYNAERSEVIKAALMAGADRVTHNGSFVDLADYRADPANHSANGLDVRYGAGQLNIYHSYHIVAAGEQNSAEDYPAGQGNIGWYGFDFDPYFGGNGGSNTIASYYFTADQNHRMLFVALVWNLDIDGGTWTNFNSSATLYDLDLFLHDVTDPQNPQLVASSTGAGDNTENLWVPLSPGRRYRLQVKPGQSQGPFQWDYALAWKIINPPDVDQDGIPDDWEVYYGVSCTGDQDSDGLNNSAEYMAGTNPLDTDSDHDGFTDGQELNAGSDPLNPASIPAVSVPAMTDAGFFFAIFCLLAAAVRTLRVRV